MTSYRSLPRADGNSPRRSPRPSRPRLESLESRVVLSEFNFPKPLVAEISKLKAKDPEAYPYAPKKVLLLEKAFNQFEALKLHSALQSSHLDPATSGFVLKNGSLPSYFSRPYKDDAGTKITVHSGYYDYQDAHPGQSSAFWVDFANHYLGGGVFGEGFVQEEVMFLETPELANAAATASIDTRIPNDPGNPSAVVGPLQGSPQPWVFTDVQRTMSINTEDLGPFRDASLGRLDRYSTVLPQSQTFNVLAMAAPKLASTADADSLPVVQDLFNTFVAGFTLAKESASVANPLINTGPIGAGVFNNSREAVFVLQDLAARFVGVNLQFWAYDASAATLEARYVQPILARYQFDAAANPALDTVSHLVDLATEALQGKLPPPTPPAPTIAGASLVSVHTQFNRQGKPIGRPSIGLVFQFSTAMNHASLANASNYQISYITQSRVRGQLVTRYMPVRVFSVTTDPTNTQVTVATRAYATNFPRGGRVILQGNGAGGLSSAAEVLLGQNVTYTISPRAGGISRW